MSNLSLQTFGTYQVTLAGKTISGFRTRKVGALLVYLVVEPVAHSRGRLLDLLWPGLPERSARSNLRQILYFLRQEIPDGFGNDPDGVSLTIANRQEIQLNPEAKVDVDTGRFEALLDTARNHDHPDLFICQECRQNLEQAVELYQGDFLSDFFLDDSNEYEEWSQNRREYYRRRALDALSVLTTINIRRKDYPQAQTYAERQLEIDNLREGAYRQLMEVLALNGRREQALAVYETCRRILTEELGMAPTARTTELYENILAGDLNLQAIGKQDFRGYDLKEVLAEGSHGAVHRAIQPTINREVAVKVIRRRYADDPDFIRRFEAEAQIVASLEHPYIVPLYDYWRDPSGAYLVMRYMRHGSLLSALKSGPWNPDRAAHLLNQIAGALAAAHHKGIVHRDLKPGNILLDEAGNAYLTDFGIAKELLDQEGLHSEKSVVGTIEYTSPEQILSGEVTPQSDIYSLGAVIYETLTGEKPFADDSIPRVLHNQLNNPMPLVTATRPDIPADVDTVLQKATAKKAAERYTTAREMAEAFFAAVGHIVTVYKEETAELLPEVAEIYNPYKGLRAFQEADADDFFGRDNLVQQLVERLGESSSRFLAIVGPSGSGKSSAVKAGLIPALRDGALPGSENWFTAEMVPGTHPLEELELALWPVAVDPPPSLVEPMQRDTRGMLRTMRRILPGEDGSQPQLLLIIDQFEELFTLVEDEERRAFFLDSLLAALNAPRSPLRVIVTLRADFYDRPLLHQEWGQIIKDNTEIVLPLNHSELTWAIREPARRMGVRLEEELVTTIVSDVAHQLGALPLLQYALTELFERRDNNQITRSAYQEIGGVQGALGRRAEGIYELLNEDGREAARQLFLRLVTLGEGIEDTRRRVLRSEVTGLTASVQEMEEVLDQFGTARLLTFDRDPSNRAPTVEVAHEALLREWPHLRRWLEQSRDDVRLQRLLAQAADGWLNANKDEAYLLRGSRLDQFGTWSEETQLALTRDEKQFLAASLAARAARQEEEEARRQRELEAARQLAESEKARADEQAQATAGLRRRAVMLGGALVVAAVLALAAFFFAQESIDNAAVAATSEAQAIVIAGQRATAQAEAEQALVTADAAASAEAAAAATAQADAVARATAEADAIDQRDMAQEERETAVEQTNLARSRELAIAATNNLAVDPELSILLAIEALSIADTVEAQNALHSAVQGSRLRKRLNAHNAPVTKSAIRPDGSMVAVTSLDGMASVWNINRGERVFQVPINLLSGFVGLQIAFSQDGTRVVTIDPGETLNLSFWEASTGQHLETISLPIEVEAIGNYSIHPDWSQIALGYLDGSVQIWDLINTQLIADLPGHTSWAEPFYSPDGNLLATIGDDEPRKILIWDVESATLIRSLNPGHQSLFVTFSPDNHWLAYGDDNNAVQVWDLEEPGEGADQVPFATFTGHGNFVFSIAFSPDSQTLVSGGLDSTAKVWDISSGENLMVLPYNTTIQALNFLPDGNQLLAGDGQGNILTWDLTPQGAAEQLAWSAHNSPVLAAALSPHGSILGTASFDGTAKIWDLSTGQELQLLDDDPEFPVMDIAFHPDRQQVATANTDGMAHVWDSTTGQELMRLEGHGVGSIGNGLYVGVIGVAFSPNGEWLATAGADGTARIWDAVTGEEVRILEGNAGFTRVAFSPDGSYLAAGGEDENVRIWEAETGQQVLTIPINHSPTIWSLAFSPDGRFFATSGFDKTARIWSLNYDALEAELLSTITSHVNTVYNLRFSPDSQILATAAWGFEQVRLWDLSGLDNSNEENSIVELSTLGQGLTTVFNTDGSLLISGGQDGIVRTLLLDADELLTLARSRVTRTFTAEECRQYRIDPCPANP